ncbi:hypothetical protein [Microbacterium sp. AK031]|uniref:hypothetical protein n=1 Tax=Microbacterium sp. AK031 TaxID=2723076 RepID=UPI00216772AF|nr:hypothetical protein [Microbacterium sp. AK031]MCS3842206.1 hypothetical protein [Microbacterium sp. AK031]
MDNGSIVFAFFGLPLGLGLLVGSVMVGVGVLMCLAWSFNRLAGFLTATILSRFRARQAELEEDPSMRTSELMTPDQ